MDARKPQLAADSIGEGTHGIRISHFDMVERWLLCEGSPELLFTDNETNFDRLFGVANQSRYVKDGIDDYLVGGRQDVVNPKGIGTKASVGRLVAANQNIKCFRLANTSPLIRLDRRRVGGLHGASWFWKPRG